MQIEKRLEELGLTLPKPAVPMANYVEAVRTENLLFLSGHGPGAGGGKLSSGRLGEDLSVEEGYDSAKRVALSLVSTLKDTLGDLDRVKRVVKLTGFVNSAPGFLEQSKVINGASDFFVELFGEKGHHTRSAVGMAALPTGIPVEIELIAEIGD